MKKTHNNIHSLVRRSVLLLLAAFIPQLTTVFAQTTSFTYQGQLTENGSPANGTYDLTFALYGASSGGSPIAGPVTNSPVAVSGGLFTVTLDFGNQFPGLDRWLEIASRTNGVGSFDPLTPRQQITSTPYAIMALNTATNAGTLSAGQITSGTLADARIDSTLARDAEVAAAYQPLDADLTDLADGSLTGSKVGTGINAANITTGTLPDAQLSANIALLNRTPQTFTGETNSFSGRVGIGTIEPESEVHILRASAGVVTPSTASLLTLENDNSDFIHFLAPATANSGILFGSPVVANDASIRYNNGNDRELSFRTLNSTRMVILTNGFVGINTLTPTNTLHVGGGATVTGNVLAGSLTVGGGTPVTKMLSTTATLNFLNTLAQTSSDTTITLTGAIAGDAAFLGVPATAVVAGGSYSAWVSAANTVTVRFLNATSGALDPASGTFRVAVVQF